MSDPGLLHREYSTAGRLEARRHNVTGCGDGLFASSIAAPVVIGADNAPAMVERADERGVDARLNRVYVAEKG